LASSSQPACVLHPFFFDSHPSLHQCMHRHHCLHRKLSSGGSSVQVVVQAPPYITFPLFPALNNPSCVLILDAARVVRWGCCEHVVLRRKFSSISPGRVVRLLSHVPDDISAPCNNQLLLYSGSSRSGDTGSVLSPLSLVHSITIRFHVESSCQTCQTH
jgi:hypothetical protein